MIKIDNYFYTFFECYLGKCYSIYGSVQAKIPMESWTCSCGEKHCRLYSYCRKCRLPHPKAIDTFKVTNKPLFVVSWAKYMYFAHDADNKDCFLFFSTGLIDKPYEEYIKRETDNFKYLEYDPTITTVSPKFEIEIETKKRMFHCVVFTPERVKQWITFDLKRSKVPKKYIVDEFLFNFKPNSTKLINGKLERISTFKFDQRTMKVDDFVLNKAPRKPPKQKTEKEIEAKTLLQKEKFDRISAVPIIVYDIETVHLKKKKFDTKSNSLKLLDNNLVPYSIALKSSDLGFEEFFINKTHLHCTYPQYWYKVPDEARERAKEVNEKLPCMDFPFRVNSEYRQYICECKGGASGLKDGMLFLARQLFEHFIFNDRVILVGFNNYNFDDHFIEYMLQDALLTVYREYDHHPTLHTVDGTLNFTDNTRFTKSSKKQIVLTFANCNFVRDDIEFYEDGMEIPSVSIKKGTLLADLSDDLKEYAYKKMPLNERRTYRQCTIHIHDCVRYVPDVSLDKACKDYDIDSAKKGIDSVKISNILADAGQMVHEYTIKESFAKDLLVEDLKPFEAKLLERKFIIKGTKKVNLTELIKIYNLYDVRATEELYKKIKDNLEKLALMLMKPTTLTHPWMFVSLSEFAYDIFENITNFEKTEWPNHISDAIDSTMFAGRCDFSFLGEYKNVKNLSYIDVTSEYPLAMTALYPIGEYKLLDQMQTHCLNVIIINIYNKRQEQFANGLFPDEDISYFNLLDTMFMATCNGDPPEEWARATWSPLPIRLDMFGDPLEYGGTSRLGYSHLPFRNRYLNSVQVKLLLYCGWKIEVVDTSTDIETQTAIYWEKSDYLFKPFVEKTGALKTEARGENKSFAKVMKLIMNSLPGKMGQKSNHMVGQRNAKTYIFAKDYLTNGNNNCFINRTFYGKSPMNFTPLDGIEHEERCSVQNHYLASFIWSYAAWIIYGTIYRLHYRSINLRCPIAEKTGIILYCDTDSIIIDKSRATELVYVEDEEIGRWLPDQHQFHITWKIKYKDFDSLIVLAKKSYLVIKDDKVVLKTLKGITKRYHLGVTLEAVREMIAEYMRLGEAAPIRIDITTLKRFKNNSDQSFNYKTIKSLETHKSLSFTSIYTKVDNVPDQEGQQCIFCTSICR